ncbi:hypothetical protein BC830DRAFT_1096823 [Chytriomyces sp. MP71]|nr:hypothetical protein BC830DRAFT_1096823 [Chytriomyces sp. MP71]
MDVHSKAEANRNAQAQYRIRKQQRAAELETKVHELRQTLHNSGERGRMLLAQLASRQQTAPSTVSDESESDQCGRQPSSRKGKRHGNVKELPCSSEEIRQLPADVRKVVQNRIAQRVSRMKKERRMASLEIELQKLGSLLEVVQTEANAAGVSRQEMPLWKSVNLTSSPQLTPLPLSSQPVSLMPNMQPPPLIPINPTSRSPTPTGPPPILSTDSRLPSPYQIYPSIVASPQARTHVELKPILVNSPTSSPMHKTKLPSLRSLGLPLLVPTTVSPPLSGTAGSRNLDATATGRSAT